MTRVRRLHAEGSSSGGEAEEECFIGSEEDRCRIERARLTEQYQASFRRRKRIFLPYNDACAWAQAMAFDCKEDWLAWINRGEKRTPYIPSDPETYYTSTGAWQGWSHFLNGTACA